MNRTELTRLPAVIDVTTAAAALGLSRTAAYQLIREGEWPTPVFRLGKLIRIPTGPILELLGIDAAQGDGTPVRSTATATATAKAPAMATATGLGPPQAARPRPNAALPVHRVTA